MVNLRSQVNIHNGLDDTSAVQMAVDAVTGDSNFVDAPIETFDPAPTALDLPEEREQQKCSRCDRPAVHKCPECGSPLCEDCLGVAEDLIGQTLQLACRREAILLEKGVGSAYAAGIIDTLKWILGDTGQTFERLTVEQYTIVCVVTDDHIPEGITFVDSLFQLW